MILITMAIFSILENAKWIIVDFYSLMVGN